MGGLLGRWYVEGPAYGGDVAALILIGPPNQGSALARGHGILRWLEAIGAIGGSARDASSFQAEGEGEAAIDLTPGSRFLETLNARPRPPEVPYLILAGDVGFFRPQGRQRIEAAFATMRRRARLLGGLRDGGRRRSRRRPRRPDRRHRRWRDRAGLGPARRGCGDRRAPGQPRRTDPGGRSSSPIPGRSPARRMSSDGSAMPSPTLAIRRRRTDRKPSLPGRADRGRRPIRGSRAA